MNEREVAEIRRRFKPEKSGVTHVRGCYVSEKGELVSQFDQSLALLPQEEGENLMALLRRTLSGGLGRNLLPVSFSTAQVVDSEEHRLLMALRDSSAGTRRRWAPCSSGWRSPWGWRGDTSSCLSGTPTTCPTGERTGVPWKTPRTRCTPTCCAASVPVKETKPALSYRVPENLFRNREVDWVVSPPECGFLFPAFEDRCANIYEALFYAKNTGENHQELVDALFRQELPPPADAQKEAFQSLLADTLEEDCSLEVVQSVQENLLGLMQEHKESKDPEPLVLSKGALEQVLSASGVGEVPREAFAQRFEEEFGPDARLSPQNLVDKKKLEVCTPDVSIRVNPERGDLVETRIIDGAGYILIRAEGGVEVNGVPVRVAPGEGDGPGEMGP